MGSLSKVSAIVCAASLVSAAPFLQQLNSTSWIIGNDRWNVTQGPKYATKLWYEGSDLVKQAWGGFVSYNGAASDLNWTSAKIASSGEDWIDVQFDSIEGEFHWVIYNDLDGAYQYFVNKALPTLGEFRTLWVLDNTTFPKGKTYLKDDTLPPLSDYLNATNVQDETWQRADGTFITKYDWSAFIREERFYGLYGDDVGSWYINPGKDEYNGDHLKQELMVHRESKTGHAVQLNMIHGTHFQASAVDDFPVGKVWGPWLWYLNDGSQSDVAARAEAEFAAWPYEWFNNTAYQSRGTVSGTLLLDDGTPAAGAYVFLGDNHPTKSTLDQGTDYYYTSYTSSSGYFTFPNVRAASYALQAWSNGGSLSHIPNTFIHNHILVTPDSETLLPDLTWTPRYPAPNEIFRLGAFDRKATGFHLAGSPYTHGLVDNCPANVNFTIGTSDPAREWCFAQSANGSWVINFDASVNPAPVDASLILTVSLAGYSAGTTAEILFNGEEKVGNLTNILNDQSVYRSATLAGEHHSYEFAVPRSSLKEGWNAVEFRTLTSSRWKGFMWDAISLAWV